MSDKYNAYQDYFKRNQHKRLVNWSIFYAIVAILFIVFFVKQIDKVNTLNFASGQLGLSMSKIKYTVGDSISFTITNNFSVPITLVDKCPKPWLHVYSYNNGSWNQISANAPASYCSTQPSNLVLKPHESITKNYDQWSSLFTNPGIYRVVAFAENYNGLAYADFQVVAKIVNVQVAPVVIYKPVYTPIYIPVQSSGGGDN